MTTQVYKPATAQYKMPFQGRWLTWDDAYLADLARRNRQQHDDLIATYHAYEANRLSRFLPHCDGQAFLNDNTNTLQMLLKGNQLGGTIHGAAWTLLRCLKTDPQWPIFTEHGIKHIPYLAPNRRVLICTSDWGTMSDAVWPHYQSLIPRYELGEYALNFADPDLWPEEMAEHKRPKQLSFRDCRTKSIFLLHSKVWLFFSVYSQPQATFESRQYDLVHCDEQIKEAQFIGVNERGRTRPHFQICFTLTGHRVKGRPDTGSGQWIHRKLYLGENNMGHAIGRYKLWIEGVPDCIYSAASKAMAYKQWVENPAKSDDIVAKRIAAARYYGGWETAGGNALSNYSPESHLIPRFDVPKDWTRYRGIDHGSQRPAAAVLAAVTPLNDIIIYAVYKRAGLSVAAHCKNIRALSGTTAIKIDEYTDPETGATTPIFDEQFNSDTEFFASVLDGRSFTTRATTNHTDRTPNIGQLYNECGLSCTPASGNKDETMLPRIIQLLEPDTSRDHIMVYLHNQRLISTEKFNQWLAMRHGQTKGAPRLYFFDDLDPLLSEIISLPCDERNPDTIAKGFDDHAYDAFKYVIACQPIYFGSQYRLDDLNNTTTTGGHRDASNDLAPIHYSKAFRNLNRDFYTNKRRLSKFTGYGE